MSNPQFTLRQAIAWIIWREPDRSLRIDRQDVSDGDALRSWWDATADIERGVRAAAIDLAEKINAGTVVASGWRVSEGTPWHGVSGAEYVERIPAGTAQNLCKVPVEWIEAVAGAWLLIDSRIVNGLVAGERYCQVTVDADGLGPRATAGNPTLPKQQVHII